MPCVYLCVHDLWKVISWVHRHPFFCWTSLWKKNAINPRRAIVIYHSLYLVIFLYMQNKFCVFFLFIDSSLMLCSNSALTGGQILSGEVNGGADNRWTVTTHPPPAANLAAWTGVTIVLLYLSIPLPGVCVQLSSYARPTTEGDPRLSWLKYPN